MSFTNELETRILEWAFTAGSPTRPTAWYVGLFTAAPGEAGGGTEVSGGSYAREAATFTVSGNTATNSGAIEFTTATADWGNVTHVAIFDAVSAGNMLAYSSLTAAKNITTGDVLRFPLNDIDITLD
jgi:hypothetical protein